MDYILKNKDIPVLGFSSKVDNRITSLYDIHVFNKNLLPLALGEDVTEKSLLHWIEKREIPRRRAYSRVILSSLGEQRETTFGYINASYGLSLNDSYWIIPADKNYLWADYNLYQADFDEIIQQAAIGNKNPILDTLTSIRNALSPEYTTNGMLAKCWYREKDGIYLYKGSTIREPFAEYYNYQLADAMGLTAVPYDLTQFSNMTVSRCPLFTDEDKGYIPIHVLISKENLKNEEYYAEYCAEIYGQEMFEDLMLYDALIGNIDRHLGNFGMLIDNNTNKILGPAPLFDNGLGILGWLSEDRIDDIENELYPRVSAFDEYFDDQISKYLRPRHIKKLKALVGFEFTRYPSIKMPENILCEFETFLQKRIQEILIN